MSAGIYMNNGVLAYSMNLEKKLKRRKNAIIIEEYKGTATGSELDKELQKMLDKHNNLVPKEDSDENKQLLYRWRNKTNNHIISSIYPSLTHIPGIKIEDWEAIN